MESIRQQKVARLVQRELSEYFQQQAQALFNGAMITVTIVRMSPDLSLAKVYLSIYSLKQKTDEIFNAIEEGKKNIRHALGQRIRNKIKAIPEIAFFIDDSLDYSQRIEDLLKK
ncbi:MAG: 30S ribosome-binding factor RbfA [Bacteroidales bacterium]